MDCNKDEACRAKKLAEEKMAKNEFEGARMIALKAKQLFPELDNISQMITVCDVHCSSQKMIIGAGKDLYGILQLENLADEATIRKQYRKLALVLHPDKNKFPGAEAAFKLIGEANMILSDKEKRSVYDIKCKEATRATVTKIQNRQASQTSKAAQNKSKFGPKTQFNVFGRTQQSTLNPNIRLSFWTYCPFCNIKYEYSREFVNAPLRCQHCLKIFIGYDTGAQGGPMGPSFVNKKRQSDNIQSKPVFQQKEVEKQENIKAKVKVKVKVSTQRDGLFSSYFEHKKTEDPEGVTKPKVKVSTQREGQFSSNFAHKKTEDTVGVTKLKVNAQKSTETGTIKGMDKKRGRKTESNESSYDASKAPGGGPGGNNVDQRRSLRQKQHVSYQEDGDDEFTSQKRSKPMKKSNDIEDQKEYVSGFGDTSDVSMPDGNHSDSDSEPELVDCPDQDFFNFDKVKEEHCFAVDQIWACYDSIDGMPRFYAHINKIYSNFKLQFTWLEPEPVDDLEIKWAENGLPVACGAFVHGETEETRDRLMFSHQIMFNKKTGSKFSFVISPQKGEIWALYKDWDINWRLDSKSQKKFKYDVVEILSVNDDCVYVGFLLKVKGFVSVFKRIIRTGDADHMISSSERFRFSHRVPSAKLTGTERAGVPPGSFELDMASLPGNFEDYCYYHEEKVKHMNGPEVGSVKVNDGQRQVSHDFRSDKLIWKFQIGQIWAFWEHGNGTRQSYAVIKKIEAQSFKLHVSLLKLCNEPRTGYNTCGIFKVSPGKPKILAADLFSHTVKAETRGNKMFNIYPREKQIWALCKKHDAGECEIVEVVETDEVSIRVTSLTRVSGSKSVFTGPGIQGLKGKIVVVPQVELNRFCHQIPAFYVTDGCLRGCWELDPTALTGLHLVEPNQV